MKPKISIIVPIYNVEKYLNRCIDSILNQTFKEFELILVNDGSLDKCGQICEKYNLIDSRIKVIHKKNGGLSSARNAGLDLAIGEYVGFVDSDDWINENMYITLYNLINKYNCDIAECDYEKVYDNKVVENVLINENLKILDNIQVLESLYKSDLGGSVVSWNKLYRKKLFNNIRFPEGKLNEDQFTTYKLYFNSSKIIAISKKLYYYYQSNSSIMRSSFSVKKLHALEALEETREFYKKNNLDNLVLWHDTLYSFVLIKYYMILKREGNKYDDIRKQINYKYKKLSKGFIENPYINKKSKILLIIFRFSPKLYSLVEGI